MKKFISTLFLLFATLHLVAQETIPLYPSVIPNSIPNKMKAIKMERDGILLGYSKISQQTLAVYLPDKKTASGFSFIENWFVRDAPLPFMKSWFYVEIAC